MVKLMQCCFATELLAVLSNRAKVFFNFGSRNLRNLALSLSLSVSVSVSALSKVANLIDLCRYALGIVSCSLLSRTTHVPVGGRQCYSEPNIHTDHNELLSNMYIVFPWLLLFVTLHNEVRRTMT